MYDKASWKKEGQNRVEGGGSKQRKGRHGDKQIDEQTRIVDGGQISDKIFTSSWLLWQIPTQK